MEPLALTLRPSSSEMMKRVIVLAKMMKVTLTRESFGKSDKKYISRDELGCDPASCIKTNVLTDFGGGHPDPNLTYAADLVQAK